ncbi:MAG: DUF4296 domain-containing protein [Bacteroidales bacterium]|nr:DUF4296 domain-containing protein [Bacteroidales bacterium]
MKRPLAYILVPLLLLVALASCSRHDIIPRRKLSKIYVEMFLRDQWITNRAEQRMRADTTLVYEPVFEKYGYTKNDYLRTQEAYMKDPKRFAKILRKSEEMLDKEVTVLKKLKEEYDIAMAKRLMIPDEPMIRLYPMLPFSPEPVSIDSMRFVSDSLGYTVMETVLFREFEGFGFCIPDTVSVPADSIALQDSIVAEDGIIRIEETMKKAGRPASRTLKADNTAVEKELKWDE